MAQSRCLLGTVALRRVVALLWLGGSVVDLIGNLTIRQLGGEPWLTADVSFASSTWNGLLASLAVVLLPILGLMMLLAIAGNVLQVGLIFLPAKRCRTFRASTPARFCSPGFARKSGATGIWFSQGDRGSDRRLVLPGCRTRENPQLWSLVGGGSGDLHGGNLGLDDAQDRCRTLGPRRFGLRLRAMAAGT